MTFKLELSAMDIDVVCWLVAVHVTEASYPQMLLMFLT